MQGGCNRLGEVSSSQQHLLKEQRTTIQQFIAINNCLSLRRSCCYFTTFIIINAKLLRNSDNLIYNKYLIGSPKVR